MFKKDAPARDAFAFSLYGLTTISSFVAATVIADDRVSMIRDKRANQAQPDAD